VQDSYGYVPFGDAVIILKKSSFPIFSRSLCGLSGRIAMLDGEGQVHHDIGHSCTVTFDISVICSSLTADERRQKIIASCGYIPVLVF
jgi:hypothetical protein